MNILAVDLGTTNLKISLLRINEKDNNISVIESITRKINPIIPVQRAYEHDPKEIRRELFKAIKHISSRHDVDAVVTSTYLFATIVINKEFEPLTNIITWIDERSDKYLYLIRDEAFDIYRRTGCPPLHIYTLPKVLWLKHEYPGLVNKNLIIDAKALLTTWFLGYPITDLSTASGTYQMLNISTLKWDSTILEIANISEDQLPELDEAYYSDYICEKTAYETGLPTKTPYILGLYDGGAMIYGLSLGDSNVGIVNLGTSGMLRVIVDKPVIDNSPYMRFQTYYMMNKHWLSGGGINNAGIVLEFLTKLLGLNYDKIDTILNQDPMCSINTPLVIPLLYRERIHTPIASTGISIFGINPETTIDHIIWGTVEGVLMLIKLIEEALLENSISFYIVKLGGGLARYKGVVKALSSVLNKRACVLFGYEASHIGCALIALNVLEGKRRLNDVIYRLRESMEYFDPVVDLVEYYAEKYRRFKGTLLGTYN